MVCPHSAAMDQTQGLAHAKDELRRWAIIPGQILLLLFKEKELYAGGSGL
jgi:hypothetical protein